MVDRIESQVHNIGQTIPSVGNSKDVSEPSNVDTDEQRKTGSTQDMDGQNPGVRIDGTSPRYVPKVRPLASF